MKNKQKKKNTNPTKHSKHAQVAANNFIQINFKRFESMEESAIFFVSI